MNGPLPAEQKFWENTATMVKIRWLLKSVRAREQKKLCAMLVYIF